jgi:hypothetical protein
VASEWPDGWVSATLREAGIPVTSFAVGIISLWQKSTPMLPYTNNPLGMPAIKGVSGELMKTGYATFSTMLLMRQQLARFLHSPAGHDVHQALAVTEKPAPAYRAIHALPWPAAQSETDWPSLILDLTSESTQARLSTVADPADRRTSGAYGTQIGLGTQQGISDRREAEYVNRLNRVNDAIRLNILGRL